MGGEALYAGQNQALSDGPSPRGRGSRGRAGAVGAAGGSIPAWAGKPGLSGAASATTRVHPRVGGEAAFFASPSTSRQGPSPRGRGSPRRRPGGHQRGGSIPAWAGKPARVAPSPGRSAVHPRVGGCQATAKTGRYVQLDIRVSFECRLTGGEALVPEHHPPLHQGPSPRGRGSQHLQRSARVGPRSIPAWAGKPPAAAPSTPRSRVHPRVGGEAGAGSRPTATWVHPRVGGEAGPLDAIPESATGPSPRGRGSRRHPRGRARHRGSIPAWAGKPDRRRQRAPAPGVHPRVGGEAAVSAGMSSAGSGPSPRGRGSRGLQRQDLAGVRSIPAWAGKPRRRPGGPPRRRVHPRVGGEAAESTQVRRDGAGPSPRGRGSRRQAGREARQEGSIPAWAGKPRSRVTASGSWRVHPRVGGEARASDAAPTDTSGPSPRGRGSLRQAVADRPVLGSIPAWAGKPEPWCRPRGMRRVHPRVGGEAQPCRRHAQDRHGPSPRGRGSLPGREARPERLGSIPAWAGKPCSCCRPGSDRPVHPRVGGEACRGPVGFDLRAGPSPRGRGSLHDAQPEGRRAGSIPAWAGKPSWAAAASCS